MKKIVLAALAAFALTLTATAQQPAAPQGHKGLHPAEMRQNKGQHKKLDAQQIALFKAQQCRKELRLDDKQYDKVFKAYMTFFQQLEQQRPAEGQKPDEAQMKAGKDKLAKQMQKVLSSVQFAEWQQMEARSHHMAKPGQRDKAERHPGAKPGMQCGPEGCPAHGAGPCPQHKARPEGAPVRPDSVPGFHGNSRN